MLRKRRRMTRRRTRRWWYHRSTAISALPQTAPTSGIVPEQRVVGKPSVPLPLLCQSYRARNPGLAPLAFSLPAAGAWEMAIEPQTDRSDPLSAQAAAAAAGKDW